MNPTLVRYMKLSTFLALVFQKETFWPSVTTLRQGDPREGLLCDDYEAIWENVAVSDEAEKWMMESDAHGWQNFVSLNKDNHAVLQNAFAQAYVDFLSRLRAIWCWFEANPENPREESAAMWDIYGREGIAIVSSLESVRASIPLETRAERLRYVPREAARRDVLQQVVREDPDVAKNPFLLKASDYIHEKELRIFAICPFGRSGLQVENIDVDKLIHEVVISPDIHPSEAKAIEVLLNGRFKVRRSEMKRDHKSSQFLDGMDEFFEKMEYDNLPGFLKNL